MTVAEAGGLRIANATARGLTHSMVMSHEGARPIRFHDLRHGLTTSSANDRLQVRARTLSQMG